MQTVASATTLVQACVSVSWSDPQTAAAPEVEMHSTDTRQPQLATLGDGMPVLAAENVQGFAVRDINNEAVGRVEDLVVDSQAGRVRFLDIADDGILGLGFGREHHLVPVDVVQDVAGDTVVLNTTQNLVDLAPHWGPLSDASYVGQVVRHFGCTPFWSSDYRAHEWTNPD
jgi:sporulation protein YlmC with PRC-barrel domain